MGIMCTASEAPECLMSELFLTSVVICFVFRFQESRSRARGTAAAYGTGGIRVGLGQGDRGDISKPAGAAVSIR